ncbi:putative receptor-like serine/threonine-protein kinase-like [Heracleum sosnowskyi]|uniref:Receptor-like serine/threonine-protein kinase-like n=1 Tax=Heracleum sosnowskyi TaxID=360622 RepID=A0AAD8N7J0_9APIA|nr:putative receptor-like serine/threonine-protein kinase-like [Heracleum sosnowskyi]
MPSRHVPPRLLLQDSTTPHHHDHRPNLLAPLLVAIAAALIILIAFIVYYFRKLGNKTTLTYSTSTPPHRFSYSTLRRATSSFSTSRLLGQGGFGSVYSGKINKQSVAVKVMDAGSLQGEREFQNELCLAAKFDSCYILSLIGFCLDRKRRRMLLVYERMTNGSLQNCLLQYIGLDQSPESCVTLTITEELTEVGSPSEGFFDRASGWEGNFEKVDVESGKEMVNGEKKKDVRWKQDNDGAEQGVVKDYVMEWIGNEIGKERPKNEWIGGSSNSGVIGKSERKKKSKRKLDWWVSLDEEKNIKRDKRRPGRAWWKEECCEELSRVKKKKQKQGKKLSAVDKEENMWPTDIDDLYLKKKMKRSKSKGSVDWFSDGLSSELGRGRRSSHDSVSGDVPRSCAISSTPSMRGTICYIAPEYCSGSTPSEMSDVYSFGMVLLVLISGRRPLQVTGSPMKEFQRANLLYWTRHLARAGKLLDLVDQSIKSLDSEQALLCITVALLCLQKSPLLRPSMKEVVAMLIGDSEPPVLPVELSPSPHSPLASKSHKKPQ